MTTPFVQAAGACSPLDAGIVAYWNFDEAAPGTFADVSGNGNDGTGIGAAGANNTPQPASEKASLSFPNDGALHFDGVDDEVTALVPNAVTGPQSVSLWFNTNSVNGEHTFLFNNNVLEFGMKDGKTRLKAAGTADKAWSFSDTDGAATLVPNTWYHLAIVSDGAGVHWYLNGTLDGSDTSYTGSMTKLSNVHIGARPGDRFTDGYLDDVRIYNRALTPAEIGSIAAGNCAGGMLPPCTPSDAGIVAYWNFDEVVPGTFADLSGNGNDGTGIGAAGANNTPQLSGIRPALAFRNDRALQFDGTDDDVHALVPNAVTGPQSISLWFNTDTVSGEHTLLFNNNVLEFGIKNDKTILTAAGTADKAWSFAYTPGSITLTPGTWHHLMIMSDGTGIYWYIDGVLDGFDHSYTGDMTKLSSVHIGARPGDRFMDGYIDDVRIYSRALSNTELTSLVGGQCEGGTPIVPFCTTSDADLAAYWKFDDFAAGTFIDSSGNGNDGTGIGAAGANNTPQPDNEKPILGFTNARALHFDGTDDEVTALVPNALSGPQSVSLWFNTNDVNGEHALFFNNNVLEFGLKDGKTRLKAAGTADKGWSFSNTDGAATLAPNTWYHLAIVSDGGGIRWYLNGVLDGVDHSYTGDMTKLSNVHIGARPGDRFTDGYIDEVRIYNRALSQSEASTLAAGDCEGGSPIVTCAPSDAGLTGYWKFDEVWAGSFLDSSSNANHGTGSGATGANNTPQPAPDTAPLGYANIRSLDFDGTDDYVQLPLTHTPGNQSVALWFNTDTLAGTHTFVFNRLNLEFGQRNDRTFLRAAGTTDKAWSFANVEGTTPLSANTWYHLAFVSDGTGIYWYLNGALDGSDTSYTGDMFVASDYEIGARPGANVFTDGRIDDVRVYNRALSQSEISALVAGQCEGGTPVSSSPSSSAGSSASSVASSTGSSVSSAGSSTSSVPTSSTPASSVSSSSAPASSTPASSVGSTSSAAPVQTLGLTAPATDGDNGARRGRQTNAIAGAANFLTGLIFGNGNDANAPLGSFGGVAPGAFGGAPSVPLTDSEIRVICSMRAALPVDADDVMMEWLAGYLSPKMDRDPDVVLDALNDGSLCLPEEETEIQEEVAVVPFPVSADGYPLSDNPTWNACVTGRVTLQQIRSNPDRNEDGNPRDCSFYHTKNDWKHPDLGIRFTWNRKTKQILLPENYAIAREQLVVSSK